MDIYDPTTGQYAPDTSGVYTPGGPITAVDSGGDNGSSFLSGLTGVFQTVGNSITTAVLASNPPRPTTVAPGSVIYNPATGQYVPAVAGTQAQQPIQMNFLLIVGIVFAAIFIFRR